MRKCDVEERKVKGRGTSSGEVTWSGVKGKERKGKERKGKERKGKERKR